MELTNQENCQIDLVGTEVVMVTVAIVMDTMIGTDGERLMDSCVEMIMIVTGSTNAYIVKTMNLNLHHL